MFSEPGKTLMDFAYGLFIALMLIFGAAGTFMILDGDAFGGTLCIVGGLLASFLTSLLLAAIGQAVESLRIIAISTHRIANESSGTDEPIE